ncbi:MAG: hypothetical protein ACOH13_11055 [Flavobacteriales bacterium]
MKVAPLWYALYTLLVIGLFTVHPVLAAAAVVVGAVAFSAYWDRQDLVARYGALNAAKVKTKEAVRGMPFALVERMWGTPKNARTIVEDSGTFVLCDFEFVAPNGRKVVHFAVFNNGLLKSSGEY